MARNASSALDGERMTMAAKKTKKTTKKPTKKTGKKKASAGKKAKK